MDNYGIGSTFRIVHDFLVSSPLDTRNKIDILIEFAICEAEAVLALEQEAGREPDACVWTAVQMARASLCGEVSQNVITSNNGNTLHGLQIASFCDEHCVYFAINAVYNAEKAASYKDGEKAEKSAVRYAVNSLVAASCYSYSANLGVVTAKSGKHAQNMAMDKQRANLRALLKIE